MTDEHARQKEYKKKKPQKSFNPDPAILKKFDKWAHDHGFTSRQSSAAFELMVKEITEKGRNTAPTDEELINQIEQATRMLADRLKERR